MTATLKNTSKPKPYKHDVTGCLNKIIKTVKKHDASVETIEFELSSIQRFGAKPQRFKTGQPITIYRKTKSGNAKKKKTYVAHIFCPFCGQKFDE